MPGCDKQKYRNMIHAFEIGLLSESDREGFEIHLLECPDCLETIKSFDKTATCIKESDSIRSKVLEQDLEIKRYEDKTYSSQIILPKVASLAFAVLMIILLLNPWGIEIFKSKESYAAENLVVVINFQNLVDDTDRDKLGVIAANLLITDLTESSYMKVLSSQRLYDIQKNLNIDSRDIHNSKNAIQIAEHASASWLLTGTILQVEPVLVVTSHLIDINYGTVVKSFRHEGEPGQSIFKVIDQLTVNIKENLGLPGEALDEPDPEVASITSNSDLALRYYLEGADYIEKFYHKEAIQSLEKALEYDSTFAIAYLVLAGIKDPGLIDKAIEYIDNTGKRERLYILAGKASFDRDYAKAISLYEELVKQFPQEKYGYYALAQLVGGLGRYNISIGYLEKVLEMDPMFSSGYNLLSYTYDKVGQSEKAIEAVNKYVELSPNEANPFDSRGDIYAHNGNLDEAIKSYQKAIEIKPDFLTSVIKLGDMYVLKGDYSKANELYRRLLTQAGPRGRTSVRLHLAYPLVSRGKLDSARVVLHDGISADKLEIELPTQLDSYSRKHLLISEIYIEEGKFKKALIEYEQYIDQFKSELASSFYRYPDYYIRLLAKGGQIVEAEHEAEKLKIELENSQSPLWQYFRGMGCIEQARGDYSAAITSFEKAINGYDDFETKYLLAEVYISAGEYLKAVELLQQISNIYNTRRAYWGIWSAKLHYYLGIAYENTGQVELAIDQYRYFLEIWSEADPKLKSVNNAKAQLENLSLAL